MQIQPFPEFENVHAVAIPFPESPDLINANVFALGKGPITLIDSGPRIHGSLGFIQKTLQTAGLGFRDIKRIVITHGHVDHFGLVASIREAARQQIECFVHAEDVWRVSKENFSEQMWNEGMSHFMAMVGMPEKEIGKIRKRFSSFGELADPLDEVSVMEDGDEFSGDGYELKVIHTPGHSPGSSCLYESRRKILFTGDHILKHITPNPLVEIYHRNSLRDPHYQSLRAYVSSVDKFIGLDVQFAFPGHGEYIDDLSSIIASYKMHYRSRKDLVWKAVKKKSRPIYYLIEDLFPSVPGNAIFLAASEIVAYLEILINEGSMELADPGPPAIYRSLG